MVDPLRPHSPEWFAALEQANPRQAAMTRRILAAAGRDDVCSVCGDPAAEDYADLSRPEEPLAVRLCTDCCGIQERLHGAGPFRRL